MHGKRKPHVNRTVYPVSVRSACTVQRESSLDHSARTTLCPYRIFSSTPYSRAVSLMYLRIAAPSAID